MHERTPVLSIHEQALLARFNVTALNHKREKKCFSIQCKAKARQKWKQYTSGLRKNQNAHSPY